MDWQPIETAPKNEMLIGWCGAIGFIRWDEMMPDFGPNDELDEPTYGMWRNHEYEVKRPTHWMPLPDPPTA